MAALILVVILALIPLGPERDVDEAQQFASDVSDALNFHAVRAPAGTIQVSSRRNGFWDNYLTVTPRCGWKGNGFFHLQWVPTDLGSFYRITCDQGSRILLDSNKP